MKKVIISIGSVLILALVVVLFVNANNGGSKGPKKAATEVKSDCGGCPSAAACEPAAKEEKKAAETGCDPATCTGHANEKLADTKTVAPAACKSACQSKLTEPL